MTFFLATPGPAQGIRDVLTDLSAAGLVAPFVWIDEESITSAADRVPCAIIEGGRDRRVHLQELLAGRSLEKVRLCVLVPFLQSAPAPAGRSEHAIADILTSNAGRARLVRLRLLLARSGGEAEAAAAPALAGWHNLLLAPEDSRGPLLGHETLAGDADIISIGRHAAPMVAGIAGLWTSARHTPFDDQQVLPGSAVRVVRSFYRRLDTSQAEEQLREQVLASGGALPLPRDVGDSVIYVDDAHLANHSMANALWAKHKDLLKGARVPYPVAEPSRKIGARAALMMFLQFLGAALRNAPMAWYSNLTSKLSSTVATAVHTTVFGSAKSAYTVVVKGVSADGTSVGWLDYAQASSELDSALCQPGEKPGHATRADLSALWRDYAASALTLADAGERSGSLPPVQIGSNRAVLRQASDVMPGPRDQFRDFPGVIGANVGTVALEPTDAMGIQEVRARLHTLEQDHALGLDARRTNSSVGTWDERVRRSFGYIFGEILARELRTSLGDVRNLLGRLEAAGLAEDPDEAARKRQKSLALWSQVISVVAIVILVGACVLAGRGLIPWLWTGAGIIAGTLLVWVASISILFLKGQQELFQLITSKRRDAETVEIDRANLRTALRDIDRIAAGYRQHQSWSKALGAFLGQPLGQAEERKKTSRRIDWGLPRNAAVGYAAPEATAVQTVATYLRQDLFRVGWLTGPWETLVRESGRHSGPAGEVVRQNPELLWSQPGVGTGSALDVWSQLLASGSVQATGGVVLWDKALTDLAGPKRELLEMMTGQIEHRGERALRTDSLQDFVAGIGQPLPPGDGGTFDRAVFSDVALTRGGARVEETAATTVAAGLGIIAVSTQWSEGLVAEDLMFKRSSSTIGSLDPWAADRGFEPSLGYASTDGFIEMPEAEGLDF